jgi:glycosyltransferase involved in cell wall biosynthesis
MKENLSSQKICHLSSVHFRFDTRIFHRECKTLRDAGYTVTVIGQRGWLENYPKKDGILVENVEGIKVISFLMPKNRFSRILKQIKLFNLAKYERAKIYHFHDPELIPLAILLKLITHAKVIWDAHEDYTHLSSRYWIPLPLRKIAGCIFYWFEKFISRYFDGIITVTENIKQKFRHPNVKLVRNLYPNKLPKRLKPEKDKDDKHLDLIFIGGIVRDRGIDRIISALDAFKEDEVTFKVIGTSNEPKYLEEIKALTGFRYVKMMGWQPYDVIMEELFKADVGILTLMLNEIGLPNKMFEYMAFGLPIIASDSPGWKEIIEGNKCGIIVDLNKPAEIERAIRFMLENPQAREEMGQNGIKTTQEKFNWSEDKKRLLDLYEEII